MADPGGNDDCMEMIEMTINVIPQEANSVLKVFKAALYHEKYVIF
jgi:hypothetical protein